MLVCAWDADRKDPGGNTTEVTISDSRSLRLGFAHENLFTGHRSTADAICVSLLVVSG